MTPTTRDLPLFFKEIHGQLSGMMGAYIDDTVGTGDNYFVEASKFREQKFQSKPLVYDNFVLAGIEINKTEDGLSCIRANSQRRSKNFQRIASTVRTDLNVKSSPGQYTRPLMLLLQTQPRSPKMTSLVSTFWCSIDSFGRFTVSQTPESNINASIMIPFQSRYLQTPLSPIPLACLRNYVPHYFD